MIHWCGVVQVYAGADAAFALVEDDGETHEYQKEGGSGTRVLALTWDDTTATLAWTASLSLPLCLSLCACLFPYVSLSLSFSRSVSRCLSHLRRPSFVLVFRCLSRCLSLSVSRSISLIWGTPPFGAPSLTVRFQIPL